MKIKVIVTPKNGVLDPQGKAIQQTLNSMNFIDVSEVRQGKYFEIETDLKDEKDAKKRLIEFQSIAENIKTKYRKTLIGKTAKVLFENKMKNNNKYFGRDEYFNSVIVESNNDLTGEIKSVKILKGNQNTLFGEIISNLKQTYYAA